MAEIKQLHVAILSLDEKSKRLTSLIKEEKETGKIASKKTDSQIGDLQKTVTTLERQNESINETKRRIDRNFQHEFKQVTDEITSIQQRIKLL